MIKLYNSYKIAKDLFKKPKLKWRFGLWKNDPCLPIYKYDKKIYLTNNKNKIYIPKFASQIFTGTYIDNFGYKIKKYQTSKHKLPKGIKQYEYVWNRNIRKKLKKYHLSWIKPFINIPSILYFDIINIDIMYKYKYDDIIFEYPPQFTLIFFGLSLSFWLVPPTDNISDSDYYWESLLKYNERKYNDGHVDIGKFIKRCGTYSTFVNGEKQNPQLVVKKDFINQKYHNIWDNINNNIN